MNFQIHGSLFEENVLFEFVFCFIKVLIAKTHDILTVSLLKKIFLIMKCN